MDSGHDFVQVSVCAEPLKECSTYLMKSKLTILALIMQVVLVLPFTEKESRSDEKIPHKIVQVPFDRSEFGMELVVKTAIEEGMFRALIKLNEFQRVVCEQLLNNTELLQELRNFDLIVYEASAACSVLVSHLLDIPHVVIFPFSPNIPRSSYFKIPLPLSYVPLHVMTTFTSKMSFTQRLMNVGLYVFYQFALHFMFERSMVPLKEKYNIAPEISCSEAVANFELLIIAADFALEYPQPLLPGLCMTYFFKTYTVKFQMQ